ncbi:hypothetical protein ONE63_006683 [Megalurothrips usitatus]|uniref:Uncharacterized protein n=1 Tax=Megalurothrips usitatus TaxID=439358 RepID=A0AAV7XV60_9NEOP|nr:hypothetical protein ONE63_006683 [Megalurothrips usitatus]
MLRRTRCILAVAFIFHTLRVPAGAMDIIGRTSVEESLRGLSDPGKLCNNLPATTLCSSGPFPGVSASMCAFACNWVGCGIADCNRGACSCRSREDPTKLCSNFAGRTICDPAVNFFPGLACDNSVTVCSLACRWGGCGTARCNRGLCECRSRP